MLTMFFQSCPLPLSTQDQGVSDLIVQGAAGGLGSLVEAWGPGKEVTGGWCKCVCIYTRVRSGAGWQAGQSLALILLHYFPIQ